MRVRIFSKVVLSKVVLPLFAVLRWRLRAPRHLFAQGNMTLAFGRAAGRVFLAQSFLADDHVVGHLSSDRRRCARCAGNTPSQKETAMLRRQRGLGRRFGSLCLHCELSLLAIKKPVGVLDQCKFGILTIAEFAAAHTHKSRLFEQHL